MCSIHVDVKMKKKIDVVPEATCEGMSFKIQESFPFELRFNMKITLPVSTV